MKKIYYYASCTVLVTILALTLIGTVAKHGFGPLLLAVVMGAAIYGVVIGKD